MNELLVVVSWFACSVHASSLVEGTRIGQIFTNVFADVVCTFQAQHTWREKVPVAKVMHDFHPAEKQLYVDLLFCARSLKATNQRDIIYSTLGSPLAYYKDGEVMVAPNYDEPIPHLQIRTAYALLRSQREACHVLLRVTHDPYKQLDSDNIPTWVPRWRTFDDSSPRPILLTYSLEHRQHPYCASYGSPSFSFTTRSDNILTVTGLMFDQLVWTSFWLKASDLQSDIDLWDLRFRNSKISAVEAVWLELLKRSTGHIEETMASFSLTLARGRPRSKDHLCDFLAYCEKLRTIAGTETGSPFPDSNISKGNVSNAEWAVTRAKDRCVAYTTQGRLALVPLISKIGDTCCIIQGMDVPVILQHTTQGSYRVAGDAYIHGVMDGELMSSGASKHLGWQPIRLQ